MDRRTQEANRRNLKCVRHAQRGERRHGAPKTRGLHPNQVRALEARGEAYARAHTALRMAATAEEGDAAFEAAIAMAEEYRRVR
jgi:hypothetical protein